VRRLTTFGFNPAWSPDGREVVFATENVADNPYGRFTVSQLWLADVDSGQTRLLFSGDAVQPAWSPDGQRVAFWAIFHQPRPAQRDLWTIGRDGGTPVPITNDAATDWSPAWSPDGRHLYFASDRGGSMNIWRVAIDQRSGLTSDVPQALTGPSPYTSGVDIAGNGSAMVFASVDSTSRLYHAEFDPVAERIIGDPAAITLDSRLWIFPDVSPDGRSLVFATSRQQEDIFICRVDGSSVQRLMDDDSPDRVPRWSPKGDRIAFFSSRSGSNQVWTVRPDGSQLTQVTTLKEAIRDPIWTPDGQRLTLVHDQPKGSTVLLVDAAADRAAVAAERLPAPPNGLRFLPWSWSRDGRRLAGYDGAGFEPLSGTGGGIIIFDVEARTYERLTTTGIFPRWLSDGRRLLYVAGRQMFVLDTNTGVSKSLLSADGAPVGSVSADDRHIYFSAFVSAGDLWLARLK
jgi:TolB protein